MWKEGWGEKHARITTEHIVPYSILNVLKYAVAQTNTQPDATELEGGETRWQEARTIAAKRREHGAHY